MLYFIELKNPSAAFRISGPDANTYLSGQFTQEIRVAPRGAAYGLWLNQKGKVLGDSHIVKLAENDYLVFSAALTAAALRQRLEDYLIADEVVLEDQADRWGAFLLWGAQVAQAVERLAGYPLAAGAAAPVEGSWVFRAWGRNDWMCLLFPTDQTASWRARLSAAGGEESSLEVAERERILSGIPAVPADIGPEDLPNEGGLEVTAISYTKGCYLGQEVMARLKNLGQVRRKLHRVRGGGAVPAPRAPLHQGGRRVGELRSVAPEAGGFVGLALLSLVNLDPRAPLSLGEGGPAIEVLPHE